MATTTARAAPPSPRTRAKMPPWYSSFPQLQQEDGTWINTMVEQSIELLTLCDGQCHRSIPDPRRARAGAEKALPAAKKKDYARLHDEFLESLLQQQARLQAGKGPVDDASVTSSLPSLSRASSFLTISSSSVQADASISTESKRKRRRPIKLSRRPVASPARLRKTQVASIDSLPSEEMEPRNSILMHLSKKEYPEPSTYLHKHCELQKDKGKGESIGSEICAKGRDACLKKVQQKMELLTQIAMSDGMKRTPDMQRKKARVTEETSTYIETRSLIQLKMGFLSMQYGVLLRWDSRKSCKINLVVLRKSCSDSFYKKSPSKKTASMRTPPPEWLMVGGSHAVFQRPDGTEVALLDAPYRVERPLEFEPSRLLAQVARVEGLNPNTQWFLKVKLEEEEYRAQLHYNVEKQHWSSTEPFEWEVPLLSGDDSLEVVLMEQKRPSRTRKKERLFRQVSLAFLDNTRISERRQVCVVEHDYRITMNVYHQSDYAYWLHQELEARKRAEVTGFVWKMPVYKPKIQKVELDDDSVFWDLCCVC